MEAADRERLALDTLTEIVQDDTTADSHDRVLAANIILHHEDETHSALDALRRHQEVIEELRGIRAILSERVVVQ